MRQAVGPPIGAFAVACQSEVLAHRFERAASITPTRFTDISPRNSLGSSRKRVPDDLFI